MRVKSEVEPKGILRAMSEMESKSCLRLDELGEDRAISRLEPKDTLRKAMKKVKPKIDLR